MPGYPRHEIPGTLRAAKQQAVDQILMGPRTACRRLITTVSTHPHDNVVGVGIGRKIVRGRVTNRQCVLSTLATRDEVREVNWEEWTPEQIIDSFEPRYRLSETGRPLPIEPFTPPEVPEEEPTESTIAEAH